jgi:glucose/arabinose dehydrogenase
MAGRPALTRLARRAAAFSYGKRCAGRRSFRIVALAGALAVAGLGLSGCFGDAVPPPPDEAPPPPPPPPPVQADAPHFYDSVAFDGLNHPTVVQFSPDGRVFVGEKGGVIKVFDSITDPTPKVFADLSTNVLDYWDRGLLGLALDPSFPNKPYVYVLYTYDAAIGGTAPVWSDKCPTPPGPTQNGCVASARLSRLQASGDQAVGAEQVLVEDWCQQFPSHSIGTIAFGPDGSLYAGSGDGASFNYADYGQTGNPCGDPPGGSGLAPPTAEGGALRSQDLRTAGDPVTLDGSIIRVNPDTGAAMGDNPLVGNPDANARRIIAYGMRNPYRFTVRPGGGDLWVGDVGWNNVEEINRIPSGSDATVEDFGWPCYEGSGAQAGYQAAGLNICSGLYNEPSAVKAPYWSYNHADQIVPGENCPTGGSSMSGLTFYAGGSYPSAYQGALFFSDYSRKCIWVMFPGGNGLPDPANLQILRSSAANPVDLKIGTGGDVFYVDHNGGTIHRIQYNPGSPPTAVLNASPTSGPAPTTVKFDASGSSDPDPGDVLSYAWDLNGDGKFDDSTAVKPSYTYTQAGVYTVKLMVTDKAGTSDVKSQVITIAQGAPTAVIDTPASTVTWKVGDTIPFSGHGTDPQDGTIPASGMSWSIILHHCSSPNVCHPHTIENDVGVSSGSFVAPDHEYPSYLELTLTVTDSSGLQDVKSVRLDPRVVNLTFQSSPSGVTLGFGSGNGVTPFVRTVIAGSTTSVSAPSPVNVGGTQYTFASWSDGGAQTHLITAGDAAATYTATYTAT